MGGHVTRNIVQSHRLADLPLPQLDVRKTPIYVLYDTGRKADMSRH